MKTMSALFALIVLDIIPFLSSKEIHVQKGLPVAVNCDVDFPNEDAPQDQKNVVCRIERSSTIELNKSITWGNRDSTEFIFDANRNETITVYLSYGNRTMQGNTSIVVQEPYDVCSRVIKEYVVPNNINLGEGFAVSCRVPGNSGIPMSKFNEFSFGFYKDCQRINVNENIIEVAYSMSGQTFVGYLQIAHVSYGESPGSYKCAVFYKGRQYVFPGMDRYELCVTAEPSVTSSNNPSLTTGQELYETAPGEDLTMKCFAEGRRGGLDGNEVHWLKNGVLLGPDDAELQTMIEEGKRCHPDPNLNVTELKQKLGSLTSTCTLRNVKVSDSGTYTCRLHTSDFPTNETIRVVVRTPASELAKNWITAVIIVAVCFAIVILVVGLRCTFKREISFFMKKHFKKSLVVSADQSVAYLVYCNDTFQGNYEKNPLKDVVAWMDQKNIPYTDPNKLSNAIKPGDPAPRNITEVIKNSKSLIIILTKDMLIKNDLEIFTSYMALDTNVEVNQSVTFICTKEMMKIVFKLGRFPESVQLDQAEQAMVAKTITTFKNFMKRRENYVICWSPRKTSHFHKDLYIALPKVKTLKRSIEDESSGLAEKGLV